MRIIRSHAFLWTLQILLAVLFAFAGSMKFVMDPAQMAPPGSPVSATFLRFIGVCECLGAIGLVVPHLTGIRPGLTPLAALGLLVIMIGAVIVTLMTQPASLAILPFVTGVLLSVVAYGRLRTPAVASIPL
jgi:uncharacterized membrane protein YphA (DoxX/SURF4 family)